MTYNKFDHLENNLKSIANQSFHDYEIILSDDGSENFDQEKIIQIAFGLGIYEKLKIIRHEKNIGTVKNYNHAIKDSQGEMIVPLSQDDEFMDAEVLMDLNKFFEDPTCKACLGKRITKNGDVFPNEMEFGVLNDNPAKTLINLSYRNFIYGATFYFRRDIWDEMKGFDEECKLLEDYPFAIKLLTNNVRIFPFERIMIRYDDQGISNCKTKMTNAYLQLMNDHVTMYQNTIRNLTKKISSRSVKRAIRYHWEISFITNSNAFIRYLKKIMIHLKYLDVAFWHKLYSPKYGNACEDYFAKRLAEKANEGND